MLLDFITKNRDTIIAIARARAAMRSPARRAEPELATDVRLSLDQLADALQRPEGSTKETMERSAAKHAAAVFALGYTVAQVVHDYGDVGQAITELAMAAHAPIAADHFRTLNRCLDNAIAEAVTEYARHERRLLVEGETERAGSLAHEMRNRLGSVQIGFAMITNGRAPVAGAVASVVARNLQQMAALVERSLMEVRVDSGRSQRQRVHLHELMAEAEVEGSMAASTHGVSLRVAPTDAGIDVDADPLVLAGAVANLLQNAFKFTPAGGSVVLSASIAGARVGIDVEDQCGGLPPNTAEQLFAAFQQRGTDRSGLGLGLFISRKGIEASDGLIRVRDVPGRGCVFTIDLPRIPTAA